MNHQKSRLGSFQSETDQITQMQEDDPELLLVGVLEKIIRARPLSQNLMAAVSPALPPSVIRIVKTLKEIIIELKDERIEISS